MSSHRERLGSVCKEKDSVEAELRESEAEISRMRTNVQEANVKVGYHGLPQVFPRQEDLKMGGLIVNWKGLRIKCGNLQDVLSNKDISEAALLKQGNGIIMNLWA